MKESGGKKVTVVQAYKVIMIIYTIALIGLMAVTVYGWFNGGSDTNYIILAACTGIYCASGAQYSSLKKKEEKAKNNESSGIKENRKTL